MRKLKIVISVDSYYYWESTRPLYNYLRKLGYNPIILIHEKDKHQHFRDADPKNITPVPRHFLYNPVTISMKVDINFVTNTLHVKDSLLVHIGHGQGLKLASLFVDLFPPHHRMVCSYFRYKYFLNTQQYGGLLYRNVGGIVEMQGYKSEDVNFFLAGNYLKLDDYYQGNVKAFEWPVKGDARPKLLFAPTLGTRSTIEPMLKLLRIADKLPFQMLIKYHFLDLQGLELKAIQRFIYEGDLLPIIESCDVVVSELSSVLYEAALMGKKVVRVKDRDDDALNSTALTNFGNVLNISEAKAMEGLWTEMYMEDLINVKIEELAYPNQALLISEFPNQLGNVAESIFNYALKILEDGN